MIYYFVHSHAFIKLEKFLSLMLRLLRFCSSRLSKAELQQLLGSTHYRSAMQNLQSDKCHVAREHFQQELARLQENHPTQINLRIFVKQRLAVVDRILGNSQAFKQLQVQLFFEQLSFRGELDAGCQKFMENAILACLSQGDFSTGQRLCRFVIEDLPALAPSARVLAACYLVIFDNQTEQQFADEVGQKLQTLDDAWLHRFNLEVVRLERSGQTLNQKSEKIVLDTLSELEQVPQSQIQFLTGVSPISRPKLKNQMSTIPVKFLAQQYRALGKTQLAKALLNIVLLNSKEGMLPSNLICYAHLAEIQFEKGSQQLAIGMALDTLLMAAKSSPCRFFALQSYAGMLRASQKVFEAGEYEKQLEGRTAPESLMERLLLRNFRFQE